MSLFALIAPFQGGHVLPWLLLYVGPDVFLPLASALAAIGGFLLMFWQRLVGLVQRIMGRKPAAPPPAQPGPDRD